MLGVESAESVRVVGRATEFNAAFANEVIERDDWQSATCRWWFLPWHHLAQSLFRGSVKDTHYEKRFDLRTSFFFF